MKDFGRGGTFFTPTAEFVASTEKDFEDDSEGGGGAVFFGENENDADEDSKDVFVGLVDRRGAFFGDD